MPKLSNKSELKKAMSNLSELTLSYKSCLKQINQSKKALDDNHAAQMVAFDGPDNGDVRRVLENAFASNRGAMRAKIVRDHPHFSNVLNQLLQIHRDIKESAKELQNPMSLMVSRSWADPSAIARFKNITELVNNIPVNSTAQWMALRATALENKEDGPLIALSLVNRFSNLKQNERPFSAYELSRNVCANELSEIDDMLAICEANYISTLKDDREASDSESKHSTEILAYRLREDTKRRQKEAEGDGGQADDERNDDPAPSDSVNSDGSPRTGSRADDAEGDDAETLKKKATLRATIKQASGGSDSVSKIGRGLRQHGIVREDA